MRRPVTRLFCLLVVALVLLPSALATAATKPRFIKETYADFQSQLKAGHVTAVTFNKKAHSVHVTATSGKLYVAVYPPADYKSLRAKITAKGVPVAVEKTKTSTTAKAATHHTLRYIAAGGLVVVVAVIAVVLGVNRRRPSAEPAGPAPMAAGSPPDEPLGPAQAE